jgi:hypothetical protein
VDSDTIADSGGCCGTSTEVPAGRGTASSGPLQLISLTPTNEGQAGSCCG